MNYWYVSFKVVIRHRQKRRELLKDARVETSSSILPISDLMDEMLKKYDEVYILFACKANNEDHQSDHAFSI